MRYTEEKQCRIPRISEGRSYRPIVTVPEIAVVTVVATVVDSIIGKSVDAVESRAVKENSVDTDGSDSLNVSATVLDMVTGEGGAGIILMPSMLKPLYSSPFRRNMNFN